VLGTIQIESRERKGTNFNAVYHYLSNNTNTQDHELCNKVYEKRIEFNSETRILNKKVSKKLPIVSRVLTLEIKNDQN
jgi:hypothetical protein